MASDILVENKQKVTANIGHQNDAKEVDKAEEEIEEKEEDRVGDTEMAEKDEAEERKKPKRERKESAKKKVSKDDKKDEPSSKEAVTPTSERPAREKKIVERYSEPLPWKSAPKGLSIGKGLGTQLKDIPNVAFQMAKRKPDDNLQILHTILYGKRSKLHSLKRNIGQFSGYVWIENEEKRRAKIKEKLDKCVKEKLADFCHLLDISVKTIVRKEELSAKLLEFLESPHATTDALLSDKAQKGKKRKRKARTSSGEASQEVSVKKRKKTAQAGEKRKRSSKTKEDVVDDKAEPSHTKNESENDNDDDSIPKEENDRKGSKFEESKEIDKDEPMEETLVEKKSPKKDLKEDSCPKDSEKSKSVKEDTPAKSVKTHTKSPKKSSISSSKKGAGSTDGVSASLPKAKVSGNKKRKVKKEIEKDQSAASKEKGKKKIKSSKTTSNVSTKEKGNGKASMKTEPNPTKEEIYAVVDDILNKVDFNTVTLSEVLTQLGTHFGVDLMDRKVEVKGIIADVINNMPDDDEGEEAGIGDAEKDNDSKDDA